MNFRNLIPGALALVLSLVPPCTRSSAASPEQMPAIYDRPTSTLKGRIPSTDPADGRSLTCFVYSQFAIKELGSGGPAGDLSIIIVPTPIGTAPTCSLAPSAGEIVVKMEGQSFVGVKGNFILISQADPYGAVPFKVLDRRTGQTRYSDGYFQSKTSDAIRFIADENDSLHLRYTRGVNGSCSLPQGGQACFARIAREAHLPGAVVMDRQGLELCTSTYQLLKMPLTAASMLTYGVDIIVPHAGNPQVISRTSPSCFPLL